MPPMRHFTAAAALLAAALLAGCAGADRKATRFYVLSPIGAVEPLLGARREPPIAVDVAALRLPQYLERPQIVSRTTGNEVTLAEYHQWGGNLAKNMMQVLARNLADLLATPEISVFSRRPPRSAHARIEVEVLQFERMPDSRVVLSAQWRIHGGADGAPEVARITDLASPVLAPGAGMEATVAAMSALLGELSRVIAATVLEQAG